MSTSLIISPIEFGDDIGEERLQLDPAVIPKSETIFEPKILRFGTGFNPLDPITMEMGKNGKISLKKIAIFRKNAAIFVKF